MSQSDWEKTVIETALAWLCNDTQHLNAQVKGYREMLHNRSDDSQQ